MYHNYPTRDLWVYKATLLTGSQNIYIRTCTYIIVGIYLWKYSVYVPGLSPFNMSKFCEIHVQNLKIMENTLNSQKNYIIS